MAKGLWQQVLDGGWHLATCPHGNVGRLQPLPSQHLLPQNFHNVSFRPTMPYFVMVTQPPISSPKNGYILLEPTALVVVSRMDAIKHSMLALKSGFPNTHSLLLTPVLSCFVSKLIYNMNFIFFF